VVSKFYYGSYFVSPPLPCLTANCQRISLDLRSSRGYVMDRGLQGTRITEGSSTPTESDEVGGLFSLLYPSSVTPVPSTPVESQPSNNV